MTQRKTFTTYNETEGKHEMLPAQLRAIRMDMGINMAAMARILEANTTSRISRNKYRSWERPRDAGEWQFIPRHIAETVEKLYHSFHDFIDTLVAMWDGTSPLVLIHRNDMFDEAQLPLPYGISVENYNQAVGKAWGKILEQGYLADLTYFSTDPQGLTGPESAQRGTKTVQNQPPENVGLESWPGILQLKSFVSWDKTSLDPRRK